MAADAGITTSQMQDRLSQQDRVEGTGTSAGPEAVGGSERIDNANGLPLDAPAPYSPQHIYLEPGERLAPNVPDAGRALDTAPDEPQEIYRLPEDRDALSDASALPTTGDVRAGHARQRGGRIA